MIRRFRVKVNGRAYEVEIEEVGAGRQSPAHGAENPTGAPRASAPPPSAASAGAGDVISPIPGKVLSVTARVGQSVRRGDELMLIESMKIENPILAALDGEVRQINVKEGDQVRTGDLLAVIE